MPPWSALTGDRRCMHDSTPKSPPGPHSRHAPQCGPLSCVDSPNLCCHCSYLHDLRPHSAPRSTYWRRVRALVTLLSGSSSPPPLWTHHLEVLGLLPVLLLAFSSHWKPLEDGTTSSVSLMAPRKLSVGSSRHLSEMHPVRSLPCPPFHWASGLGSQPSRGPFSPLKPRSVWATSAMHSRHRCLQV